MEEDVHGESKWQVSFTAEALLRAQKQRGPDSVPASFADVNYA